MIDYEKAKAYDEALERCKQWASGTWGHSIDDSPKDIAEFIFPQLAESEDESEDERIGKCISMALTDVEERLKDCLAYLEKQEEQKSKHLELKAGKWYICHRAFCCRADHLTVKEGERFMCEKDGVVKGFVIKEPEKYFIECSAPAPMEDEQKEQKPAEWSEDYREEDIQTRFAFYTYKDDASVLYLSNVFVEETSRNHGLGTCILKAAEKVAEAIGAATICLKAKQDSPANAWYRKHGYVYMTSEDGYDWLEKTLEYLKPIKPAEWSDEDRLHYANVLEALEYVKGCKSDYDKIEAVKSDIAWFKSLRNRVGKESLQPHWKPSEEQMKAFKGYIEDFQERAEAAVGGWNNFDVMIRLYEQIKKL